MPKVNIITAVILTYYPISPTYFALSLPTFSNCVGTGTVRNIEP